LTPPGAPGPVMKSLDQVEPRTDVLTLPTGTVARFAITTAGSYYLSSNIVGSAGQPLIEIDASDVTLDLRGFSLIGNGAFRGITANTTSGVQRIRVANGSIVGCTYGIDFTLLGVASNVVVEDVRLAGFGGAGGDGISAGDGLTVRRCTIAGFYAPGGACGIIGSNRCVVEDCVVDRTGSYAIYVLSGSLIRNTVATACGFFGGNMAIAAGSGSTVVDCTASGNYDGITAGAGSSIIHCVARGNSGRGISSYHGVIENCVCETNWQGIEAGPGALVADSVAAGNRQSGIWLTSGSTATRCTTAENGSSGIHVDYPGCLVSDNTCRGNNTSNSSFAAGIYINESNNRVDGNHVTGNGFAGIAIATGMVNNLVVRNYASGNGTSNYLGTAGNDFGPITNSAAVANSWANFSH
jgi:parallel beta-helix repeat protein